MMNKKTIEDNPELKHSGCVSVTAHRPGFTFVEMLAAMVFVAIVIPVAIQGLTVANRAGVLADRKRVAGQLADRILTELTITDEWKYASNEGDFGEEWPGYRWVFEEEAWEEDTLRLVTVWVLFYVQDREYGVRMSTLVEEATE
ncbi:MAG: type II secretion system protein [bacterium]